MIAVDTNVLLRYLLNDDAAQADTAASLIKGGDAVLITDVVLAGTLWTLSGKKYRLNKDQLAGVVHALFEEPNVRFEDGAAVWMALNDYLESDGADFADALIINKARAVAKTQGGPFSGSYTFDKAARKLQGARTP
ncbi:MAG: type II toxin-antitoxin system VapC family toxin [Candidatus Dadabacteria bacterium]|nr:type II toxin-antitoxin system VapC family toxin [Candidatus Dadabacteria bacterium]MYI73464.1 type II toxin-antitoxin system VapC family toxin [Candidatus Dadabacteria bacterium]